MQQGNAFLDLYLCFCLDTTLTGLVKYSKLATYIQYISHLKLHKYA